jgi:hypothetical protein
VAFLPCIQTLAFSARSDLDWKHDFSAVLVDTLTSRWEGKAGIAQLLEFEFIFSLSEDSKSDDEFTEGVPKLKEKGMRINVRALRL